MKTHEAVTKATRKQIPTLLVAACIAVLYIGYAVITNPCLFNACVSYQERQR